MQRRVMWVHGIGAHSPGYSAEWQRSFNHYFNLEANDYVEVCWNTVFQAAQTGTRSVNGSGDPLALTPQEQLAAEEARQNLETMLQARSWALQQAQGAAMTRRGGQGVVEYSQLQRKATTRGALDWLFNPDEYLGDFAKYLVSRNVRNAVKEKAKEQLRPLATGDVSIAIIAHSWGTVVAYDSLLDLEVEMPTLKAGYLFTLGSPLWLVRHMLEDRSGRKPGQLAHWINIHARGDLVGSWLQPAFRVDKDFAVPDFGGVGAHSSYFVTNNEAVQRDIIAQYVLSEA
jgi:hypothetical protein